MTKWEDALGLGNNQYKSQTQSNVSLLQQYPDLFRMINPPAPIPFPELPSIPSPQRMDESRVAQLTQQFASPAIRAGRMGLREVMAGGSRGTPIQQSYRARGAMAGMGDIISSGIASARSPALGIAGQEATSAAETEKLRTDLEWKKRLMTFEEARKQQNQTYEQQLAEQQRMIGQRVSEQSYAIQRNEAQKKEKAGGGGGGGSTPYTDPYAAENAARNKEWQNTDIWGKPKGYWDNKSGDIGSYSPTSYESPFVDPYSSKNYPTYTSETDYNNATPYGGGGGTISITSQPSLANYGGYDPYTGSTFNPNYNTNYYNNNSGYNTEPSLASYSSEGY